ncbi:hypothetical protein NDU88_004380 [Pleurodeles waltl]|uniref:Uncharacterized protein n=1 Tax=Pleurodeles waltl TaxID=8319 RepID=A0AAV7UGZ1_PLEWA|nr:hypothetical protein NDU88_004380 [Pleurodeles waltl]
METWERLQTRVMKISGFPHKKGRRTREKGERSSLGGRRERTRRRRRDKRRRTTLRKTGKDAQKDRAETRRRALAATTLEGRGLTRSREPTPSRDLGKTQTRDIQKKKKLAERFHHQPSLSSVLTSTFITQ